MQFTLNDIEINLTAGIMIKDGQTLSIRAKTLSVLKYLIEHQKRVVIKQELLSTVWHGVVVQEQVLVQSIKEIRDLLGSHTIKTYPRQGYQWTGDLKSVNAKTTLRAKLKQPTLLLPLIALLSSIIFVTVYFSLITPNNKPINANQFTVSFLPVFNDMPDDIHDWVPLQGMSYLNDTLSKTSQLTIVDNSEYNDLTKTKMSLAKQLGTNLVVQTRLLGYPQDFQLQYSLHLTHSIERGVIFSQSVKDAFDQLIKKIAVRFDQFPQQILPSLSTPYISDFSNEAFARGIEHYLQGQYTQSISFFSSALQSNRNLLAARRYLAASFINSGKAKQGVSLMKENIEQAQLQQNHREEIRSNLMLGVLLMNGYEENTGLSNNLNINLNKNLDKSLSKSLAEAEHYIQSTKVLAEQYQDLLFSAYAHEELAKIKRLQKKYPEAISLLNKALTLHQNFRGDYGQTRSLIELALVADAQKNHQQAADFFAQATIIANKNGVATNKVSILLAMAQVQLKNGDNINVQKSIEQAMFIAQQASSNLLINRIKTWQTQRNLKVLNVRDK